jgi:hypothetical protein
MAGIVGGRLTHKLAAVSLLADHPQTRIPRTPAMSAGTSEVRPVAAPQYEFTTDQNKEIAILVSRMRLVGLVLIVFGILGIIAGIVDIAHGNAGSLIQGILNLFLGIFTRRGANEFDKIVRTQGRDISHLMAALRNVGAVYGVFYWIIMLFLILMAIWVVVTLLALAGVGVAQMFR